MSWRPAWERVQSAAVAVGRELSVRTLQFYGGVALIGFGSPRLAIAGGVLVVHAMMAPFLVRRGG